MVPIFSLTQSEYGEAFDNYENVMRAIGLCMGYGKITVSTSGRVEEIERFTREAHLGLKLAVSLNAPNDFVRSKLMPVNRKWDLAALKKAMLGYCNHPKRKIFILLRVTEGTTVMAACGQPGNVDLKKNLKMCLRKQVENVYSEILPKIYFKRAK